MGAAETTTTTTPDPKRSAAAKKAAVTRQVNADRAKAKKSRAAATAAKEKAAANRKAAEKPTDAHPEPVSVKDLSDAQRKKLAAKANKYPRRVHRDTRAELHAMGLVAQGLKGRALKLWIEDGETPAETVKRTPPAPKTRKTKTGEKAGPTVQDAVVKVLEKNPATIKQLIEKVSKLRKTPTDRAVITRVTRKGQLAGWWTIEDSPEGRVVTLKKK